MSSFLIQAVLMAALPGYRVNFPVTEIPREFIYTEHQAGREVARAKILEQDRVHVELTALVTQERHGWRYDLTTYAPQRMFKAQNMNINCTGMKVVVNYDDPTRGEWVQISKEVKSACPVPR